MVCASASDLLDHASASDLLDQATAWPAVSSWMLVHRSRSADETHF
jgi:hypothetical protein